MKNLLMMLFILGAVFTMQAQMVGKTKIKHEMAPLPYAYDALEKAIDKETMEIHYDKHYRGYYTNFLKAIEGTDLEYMTMEQIFADITKYPDAVRNNAGGYFNHAMYWTIMSPNGGGTPTGELATAIDRDFGSFEEFKKQFSNAGATRFGSGWAWLSLSKDGKLFVSSSANQNNPLMDDSDVQGTPILCMDVWEHAYYLRYQNKRGSYIDNFWTVVNWDEVVRRFAAVK
jgi:Fe-Mn family superoxide dismutase